MSSGTVVRIHRDTLTLDYLPSPRPGIDIAQPGSAETNIHPFTAGYVGDPPAPLSEAEFTPDGGLCLGPSLNPPIEIVHEHFTSWANMKDSPGAICGMADTGLWNKAESGGGTGVSYNTSAINAGQGVFRLRSGNANGSSVRIGKDPSAVARPAGTALWFYTRIYLPGVTLHQPDVGLVSSYAVSPDATDQRCKFVLLSGNPNWWASCQQGASTTYIQLPFVVTAATWYDLEFILDADQGFAAFWVNGDGPFLITTTVPTVPLTPWLAITSRDANIHDVYCDLINLDALSSVANPQAIGILS